MTQALTIDQNNDIVLNDRGNLSVSSGAGAVADLCKQAAQAQIGEMVFDLPRGLPSQESVFSGAANLPRWQSALRTALLRVDGVTAVDSIETEINGDALVYAATIRTIYGPLAVSNG